jgi:hypothetical protein
VAGPYTARLVVWIRAVAVRTAAIAAMMPKAAGVASGQIRSARAEPNGRMVNSGYRPAGHPGHGHQHALQCHRREHLPPRGARKPVLGELTAPPADRARRGVGDHADRHRDLGVGHLPGGTGVLAGHARRRGTALEQPGVVDHPRHRRHGLLDQFGNPGPYRFHPPLAIGHEVVQCLAVPQHR